MLVKILCCQINVLKYQCVCSPHMFPQPTHSHLNITTRCSSSLSPEFGLGEEQRQPEVCLIFSVWAVPEGR